MVNGLSRRYWAEILEATMPSISEGSAGDDYEGNQGGDISIISNYRAQIPIPQSPQKMRQ
jgi:hypothetical protein